MQAATEPMMKLWSKRVFLTKQTRSPEVRMSNQNKNLPWQGITINTLII